MKKLVVLLSVVLFISAAPAATITTADGSGADTFVGNDTNKGPDNNYGGSNTMDIRNYTDVRAHIGFVRFDISGTADLTDMRLELYIIGGGYTRDWDIFGLTDETADNWDEMGITYNNSPWMLPATAGNFTLDETKLTHLGIINVPSSANPGLVSSNTTDLNLSSFLAGDTNGLVTMVLISSNASGRQFYAATKEGVAADTTGTLSAPTLTNVPEPTTMALLGLGGLLTIRRKRS